MFPLREHYQGNMSKKLAMGVCSGSEVIYKGWKGESGWVSPPGNASSNALLLYH